MNRDNERVESRPLIIGTIVLLVVFIVYLTFNLLHRQYGAQVGHLSDTFFKWSQWSPEVSLVGVCGAPTTHFGDCLIEGEELALEDATRTCALPQGTSCLDFNGARVKGSSIPFKASCNIPYCGWSPCYITFGEGSYVTVQSVPSGRNTNTSLQRNVPVIDSQAYGSLFYMQRLAVSSKDGLITKSNGTLARFYYPVPGTTNTQILCYQNGQSSGGNVGTTAIMLDATASTDSRLDIWILLESFPTASGDPDQGHVIARKILAFGGRKRTDNPSLSELAAFNTQSQNSIRKALNASDPTVILKWDGTKYFGYEDYLSLFVDWNPDFGNLFQDVVELRLPPLSSSPNRPFYKWL